MASSKQVVAILDDAFSLAGTGRYHAEFLRAAGLLPSTPGRPEPLAPEHIATLLLSILLGEPCSNVHAIRVHEYLALRAGHRGPTLGEILTGYVNSPFDLFELRLDLGSPGAAITFRQRDHAMSTIVFAQDQPRGSGVERYAVLSGGTLIKIAAAIEAAPEIKAGRRPNHRKSNAA